MFFKLLMVTARISGIILRHGVRDQDIAAIMNISINLGELIHQNNQTMFFSVSYANKVGASFSSLQDIVNCFSKDSIWVVTK
jgi:hypothetical protein